MRKLNTRKAESSVPVSNHVVTVVQVSEHMDWNTRRRQRNAHLCRGPGVGTGEAPLPLGHKAALPGTARSAAHLCCQRRVSNSGVQASASLCFVETCTKSSSTHAHHIAIPFKLCAYVLSLRVVRNPAQMGCGQISRRVMQCASPQARCAPLRQRYCAGLPSS